MWRHTYVCRMREMGWAAEAARRQYEARQKYLSDIYLAAFDDYNRRSVLPCSICSRLKCDRARRASEYFRDQINLHIGPKG